MTTTDLVEFLLARIAEDEAAARPAAGESGGYYGMTPAHAKHIARWDPARVLAECDAKREIVTECARLEASNAEPPEALQLVDVVLKQLALPYADHSDFQQEWRP